MTRRHLLSLFAFLPALVALPRPARKYVGPMTLDRERTLHHRGVKVTVRVHGEDVTSRCQYADDTPGQQVARLLKRDALGHFYCRPDGEVARETITDGVVIDLQPASNSG